MDRDLVLLIQLIIINKENYLDDIERETNSTRRQVIYRLDKLNAFIKSNNKRLISIGVNREIIVDPTTKDFLKKYLFSSNDSKVYYLNRDERKLFLFLCMFSSQEYLSLNHFINYLDISKSTIQVDLNELAEELQSTGVKLEYSRLDGYYLSGSELDIRRYMMNWIISIISEQTTFQVLDMVIDSLHLYTFDFSKLIIQELSEKHNIIFVEDRLNEFIYIFIFLTSRIIGMTLQEYINDIPKVEKITTFKEYIFTNELIEFFPFREKIVGKDREFICSWILGVSFGNVLDDTEDCLFIAKLVTKIMTRFELLSGIHYKNIEEKFKHIYAHFRPAYYRLLFGLPIYNPLREKVKLKYPELFNLVVETMRPIGEMFQQEINDDELTYLTMHFASIYIDEPEQTVIKRKKAIVICLNGIGSSVILYNELKLLFPSIHFLNPVDISNFNPEDLKVDIIFTTKLFKEIMDNNIPVVKVNPVMDEKDKVILFEEVNSYLGHQLEHNSLTQKIVATLRKHLGKITDEAFLVADLASLYSNENASFLKKSNSKPRLKDIISKDLILLKVNVKNDLEAVKISLDNLLKYGKITENYYSSVIRLQKQSPSYFAIIPNIALPHTKAKEGALENALSIVTLQDSIEFGNSMNNPVKFLFGLSAVNGLSHIDAMDDLLELINEKNFLNLLATSDNPEEIIEFINTYDWRE